MDTLHFLNECHCWGVNRTCSSSSMPHGFGWYAVQLSLAWTNTCGLSWAGPDMIETGLLEEPSCLSESPLWQAEYFPRVHQLLVQVRQTDFFVRDCLQPLFYFYLFFFTIWYLVFLTISVNMVILVKYSSCLLFRSWK